MLLRDTLDVQKQVLGETHIGTLVTLLNLAKVAFDRGEFEAAAAEYDVVARSFAEFHPDHFLGAIALNMQGRTLTQLDDFAAADVALESAYDKFNGLFGPADSRTRQSITSLIELHERSGELDKLNHWRGMAGSEPEE